MTVVKFTKKDLNFGKLADPGWYRVRIDEVTTKVSKDGKSMNYLIQAEVLFNAENGDTKFSGVGIGGFAWMFNSKMMGPAILLLGVFDVIVQEDQEIDLKAAEGRELDVYVGQGLWENKPVHKIDHRYRKPNPSVTAKTA